MVVNYVIYNLMTLIPGAMMDNHKISQYQLYPVIRFNIEYRFAVAEAFGKYVSCRCYFI